MSQKASGYERIEGDRYFTPAWVVEVLMAAEHFRGTIVDPGAGDGHILEVFRKAGHDVKGFDLIKSEATPWYVEQCDFFDATGSADSVVGNPAYGSGGRLAVKFIERSLEVTKHRRGKVAMLLRVDFDSASTRSHIFGDHPAFAAKYTLTKRVRWANIPQVDEDGKPTPGPTDNHMWAVWDWSRRPGERPYYGYLPLKEPTP